MKDFISQLKNIMQPVSRQEARKLVQKERKKNHACGIFGLGKCPENGNFDFKVYGNCARGRWDECQWYIN